MCSNVRRAGVRETKNGAQVEVNCKMFAVHEDTIRCRRLYNEIYDGRLVAQRRNARAGKHRIRA